MVAPGAESIAGALEELPCLLVLAVADPDVEVAVDPRTAF
jgi:hypothetical protein